MRRIGQTRGRSDVEEASPEREGSTVRLPGQGLVRQAYSSKRMQVGLAVVIMLNFAVSALETQLLPEPSSSTGRAFAVLEYIFNVLFTVELIMNLYAYWFFPFFNAWNVFDLFVVVVSWVSVNLSANGAADIPGLSVLRLFRAFRVFRLFKRVEALSLIVQGITQSIPGVANACLMLILVMGIWSIIAVDLFRQDEFDEFFGDFGMAMLTTFQMMTFDSWVSGVARPVTMRSGSSIFGPIFFVSYAVVSSFMMLNVVVAILLDKFTEVTQKAKQEKEEAEAARSALQQAHEEQQACDDSVSEHMAPQPSHALVQRSETCRSFANEVEMYAMAMEDRLLRKLERLQDLARAVADPAGGQAFVDEIDLEEYGRPREALCDLVQRLHSNRIMLRRVATVDKSNTATQSWHSEIASVSCHLPLQEGIARFYESAAAQVTVALIIFLNFVVSAVDAQLLPKEDEPLYVAFQALELFFNAFFLVELAINLYAHWFRPFWTDPWNWFDVVIVTISWVSMLAEQGGIISVLRLFRAFRVFRLFKRVEALRIILVGIIRSLPGVANAFVLLGLIMGIWSIIGVNQFGGSDSEFQDEFGTFAKAMLTMFQIMTFDSWCSGVARPVILRSGANQFISAVFFVSYVFISGLVMANVILAILLDNFLEASKEFHAELEAQKALAAEERMLKRLQEEARSRRTTTNSTHRSRSNLAEISSHGSLGTVVSPNLEAPSDEAESEVDTQEVLEEFLQDGGCSAPRPLLAAEFRLTARFAEVEATLIAEAMACGTINNASTRQVSPSEPPESVAGVTEDAGSGGRAPGGIGSRAGGRTGTEQKMQL